MEEVAIDGPGKGADEMQMFFELVVDGLNLRSPVEQVSLPLRRDFRFLFVVGCCENDGFESFPDKLPHDVAPVVGVAHGDSGPMVDEFGKDLAVVDIGGREVESAEFPRETHGGVQLESVVRSLVVVAEGSNVFGDPMLIRTMNLAHLEHGGIHETDRRIRAKVFEKMPQLRQHPVAMGEETVVLGKAGKLGGEIETREGVQILEGLLMKDDGVPDEQCHQIAVLKHRRSAASGICLFWKRMCYPCPQSDDMVSLQREHSESGWR